MRGCFILKISQVKELFTLIISIYEITGIYLILSQPTQFQPPKRVGFGRFSVRHFFRRSVAPTRFVSKDREFSCASFDLCQKFSRGFPPTQTPTQKFKSGFSKFCSQEIGSGWVSFQMIFEALQFELFRFNFRSLSSKILKIPEFNLLIALNHLPP